MSLVVIGGGQAGLGVSHELWALGIAHVVLLIIAAMAAMRGEWYEIPFVGKYARQAVQG